MQQVEGKGDCAGSGVGASKHEDEQVGGDLVVREPPAIYCGRKKPVQQAFLRYALTSASGSCCLSISPCN